MITDQSSFLKSEKSKAPEVHMQINPLLSLQAELWAEGWNGGQGAGRWEKRVRQRDAPGSELRKGDDSPKVVVRKVRVRVR